MEVLNRYSRTEAVWQSSISPASLARATSVVLAGLLAASAAMMLARRLAGALVEPLPALSLILVGAVAGLLAIAACVPLATQREGGDRSYAGSMIAAMALFFVAAAVSIPGSSPIGIVVMWLIVIGAEGGLLTIVRNQRPIGGHHVAGNRLERIRPAPGLIERDAEPTDFDSSYTHDANVTQQLKYQTAEGRMAVEGWQRVDFIAGQRIANAHIAFCPAFSGPPAVDAEPLDGPACEIRPMLVLPWGVRWEVRLDAPAAQLTSVAFEFLASAETTGGRRQSIRDASGAAAG